MIIKIINNNIKKGGKFGINYLSQFSLNLCKLQENYSLLFYSNLCKLEEIIFSIILFQSSRIAGKLLSLSFIPIFANWKKLFSLLFYPNLLELQENYFSIILFQSSGIGGKFPQIIATFLQYYLYTQCFCHILDIVGEKCPDIDE